MLITSMISGAKNAKNRNTNISIPVATFNISMIILLFSFGPKTKIRISKITINIL